MLPYWEFGVLSPGLMAQPVHQAPEKLRTAVSALGGGGVRGHSPAPSHPSPAVHPAPGEGGPMLGPTGDPRLGFGC